jgi:vacuolar-type H+-ATPase subunit I/STV1
MFGDLGHGGLMFLFAAFLVLREKQLAAKKSDNEVYTLYYINIKKAKSFIFKMVCYLL